jgi:hypothetical protein
MNYSDIKKEILENWEQFADNPYPEELLNEFADSALPIYYSEIISDWQEMPSEFDNVWAEEGYTSDSITALMSYDLENYYRHQYHRIYNEIMHDQEQLESESENA